VNILFKRIYINLIGSLSIKIKKNHYFLFIKNKATLLTFVYFIKLKDKTLNKFIKFKKKYENLTNKKLKVIRADRGREFNSKDVKDFGKTYGISIQYSAPYVYA
jgi:hypothetical protein